MDTSAIYRLERLNYVFGGIVVIVCAIATTRSQALGAAVGVALTCLNFWFLRRLVFRWTEDAKRGDGAGGTRVYLIMPKMIGLMVAVVLCLKFLPIDPIFFVIGYSVFIVSITVEGVLAIVRSSPPVADAPTGDSPPVSTSTSSTPT
jgi:ATP synthase I chain